MSSTTHTPNRLLVLDYLRGFFIVVIIIDHLSRWPSVGGLISGKALLWITAAEGFVIISGLLVGYVRGYKNRSIPIKTVSNKLLRRAGMLYLWSIIATLFYTAIAWYIPMIGGSPGLPVARGDWLEVTFQVVTLQYTYVWVHFLTLYALFLAASPLVVWLLRRGLAWLVVGLSLGVLVIGWQTHIEALQWQALFFIPSVAGYYLEPIRDGWKKLTKAKRSIATTVILGLTASTVGLSIICTFYSAAISDFATAANSLFAKDTISLWRMILAFVWFIGFLLVFNKIVGWLSRYVGWLLLPIGAHSLTAYIIHGVAICIISFTTTSGDNIIFNTLLGLACVMMVWVLLQVPIVRKVVPS